MGINGLVSGIEHAQKSIDGDAPLEQLEALRGARDLIDWYIERAVEDCRNRSTPTTPWRLIGEALGISRQAAFKRFTI